MTDLSAGAATAAPSSSTPADVPADKVNLRLLLVNGQKSDFLVSPSDRIDAVKQAVFAAWPKEWTEEVPAGPGNLRILLRGKFLEDATTIKAAQIPAGETTIVHLLIRPDAARAPAANAPAKDEPADGQGRRGGCQCAIL
ncbi:ubiquitin-2 like Rad60 SUMO-like-domain-containing protein [Zopfochytrium polystomum]|nr:ubiquitin-2 like Rad60 SUMO-like-domain-containing protein [Zopfochytrium polystomum]